MTMSPRQEAFVGEYLLDMNGTAAAVRAGYSPVSAARLATRMLATPEIAAAVAAKFEERRGSVEVTAGEVVEELGRIVFADPADVIAWGPDGVVVKDSATLTPEQRRMVVEVAETRITSKDGDVSSTIKVKLRPRDPALALLAKHLGLIPIAGGITINGDEQKILIVDGGPRGGQH
jgi:phage terminase small subunit